MENANISHQNESELLSEELSRIRSNTNINQFCLELLPAWALHIAAARNHANVSIEALSRQFEVLSQRLQAVITVQPSQSEVEGGSLWQAIDEILVTLQFQDRVNQMLQHVEDDIRKLHNCLLNGIPIDLEAWLASLASTYTMAEQHLLHAELAALRQQSNASLSVSDFSKALEPITPGQEEITFF